MRCEHSGAKVTRILKCFGARAVQQVCTRQVLIRLSRRKYHFPFGGVREPSQSTNPHPHHRDLPRICLRTSIKAGDVVEGDGSGAHEDILEPDGQLAQEFVTCQTTPFDGDDT